MAGTLAQIVAVTGMNLRTIGGRLPAAMVSVVGIAGVVGVLVVVLSISEGFRAALALSGRDDVAIVLRGGSTDELASGVPLEAVRFVEDAPAIVRREGKPEVSPELYVIIDLPMRRTGSTANVPLRGVGSGAAAIRGHFRLVEGRYFTPGTNEVIVGNGAASQFRGVEVGDELHFGNTRWRVVGRFTDQASVSESELWTDAIVLQGAYNRGTSYQSVRVRLPTPAAMEDLKRHLGSDPRFDLSVRSEREFLEGQSSVLVGVINTIGTLIAVLMGTAAVFAALNTMYSAVSARSREIALLRALGFGAVPVVVSVLVESLLLGLAGGVLGGAAAYAGFNGFQASTLNFQSFSQVSFAFTVTPGLLAAGLLYALALGLVGGLLPGVRAARQSVTQGLREL